MLIKWISFRTEKKRNLIKRISNYIFSISFLPWILGLLCFLAYGLFLGKVGFYMDDWYLMWWKHAFGSSEYIKFFNNSRPLISYYFIVANFLMGGSDNPLVWQIVGLITRWMTAIAFWQMLNTIWPKAKKQNAWAAVLSAVFPGFTQHWIVFIYSFFFLCLAGFFFSITLMVKAIQKNKYIGLNYLLSVLIMAYVVPASEFYAGLELTRLCIIWFTVPIIDQKFWKRIFTVIKIWAPYGIIYGGFLLWRGFFFQSVNHALEVKSIFSEGFFNALISTFRSLYQVIVDSILRIWVNPFNLNNYPESGIVSIVILVVSILVFIGMIIWQKNALKKASPIDQTTTKKWRKQALTLAVLSLCVAIIPFLSANLPIDIVYPYDRFLLAFLMGSCLFVVWAIESIESNEIRAVLFIAAIVATSTVYQISNANFYKNLWSSQKRFYWHMVWRMPDIEKNTMVIAYEMPYRDYWTGGALTAQLNWTYNPDGTSKKVDYLFVLLNSSQKKFIPKLIPNQAVEFKDIIYSFSGNSSQSIFVHYSSDGCMRVLDSVQNPPAYVWDDVDNPYQDMEERRIKETINGANLTDLSLISSSPSETGKPLTRIVGDEPAHGWCYYFEKADLAWQNKDFETIIDLFNEADQKGLSSNIGSEYYPFVDAFAHLGNMDKAIAETEKWISNPSPASKLGFCSLWRKIATDFPGDAKAQQMIDKLECDINSY